MVYMGSKNRISKELLLIITKYLTKDMWYVEPFGGGANMIDKVKHDKRLGNDYNEYLIILWKALQKGWIPPDEVNERKYKLYKKYKPFEPTTAFIGIICSFGANWFGSFARNKSNRNYAKVGINNIMKQLPNIKEVLFTQGSYSDINIEGKGVWYCDPPYINTTGYKDKFNHALFYTWVRFMISEGHIIYISEYVAPDDFISIWEKEVICNIDNKNNRVSKPIEKLFMYKPQYLGLRKKERLKRHLQRIN